MPDHLIEVAPKADGWAVTLRRRLQGVFAGSADAVAYARGLADELEQRGQRPRIRVHFYPIKATLAH
jgi:hypothetical protein